MSNFADLGLSEAALSAVKRLGYEDPTPVQEQSIPFVLEGRDLIAAASTGTGKTAAFLLPALSMIPRDRSHGRAPRLLVVSPTRELAQQSAFTCMKIAHATGHFVTTVFGGTSYTPQIKEIKRGTDVLIATPGRLNDLMDRGVVNLGGIEILVLDEADRMLDMGFLPDVTTIVEATPGDRQTLLFSATIDRSIERNLGSLLRDPAVVQIAHKGETAETVEQFVMPIAQRQKPELLQAVLEEKGSKRVIVFARTRTRTEECAETLRDAGFSAESIHSDKSQGQRRHALENFRRGKTDILVATDVLARGIDVTSVDHVINFDMPDMPEDYVHRIGRTGRAGEAGYAISFVSPDTRRMLRDVEKLIGREIPFMPLEGYELDPSMLKKSEKGRSGRRNDASKRGGGTGGYGKRSGAGSYGNGGGRSNGARSNASEHGSSEARGTYAYGRSDNKGHNDSRSKGYASDRQGGFEGKRDDSRTNPAEKRSGSTNGRGYGKRPANKEGKWEGNKNFTGKREDAASKRSGSDRKQGSSYGSAPYAKRNGNGEGGYAARRSSNADGNRSSDSRGNRTSGFSKDRFEGRSTGRFDRSSRSSNSGTFNGSRSNGSAAKQASAKRQKQRPASVTDIRSYGEHKSRTRNKRMADVEG